MPEERPTVTPGEMPGISEVAVRQNQIESIERAIQDAEDMGANVREMVNVTYGKNLTTPLHVACTEGHFDLVCLLLQNGANINTTDKRYNWTALHCAAQNHVEICEILLRYGADISILSNRGTSAFQYVCKLFVDERLHSVQHHVLSEMLAQGQDINQTTQSGETALHHACIDGNAFTTNFLLNHGADFSLANKHGEKPIHYACRRGVEKVVSLLLEAGADPETSGGFGTPLEIAEQSQQQAVVDLIKLALQDRNGYSESDDSDSEGENSSLRALPADGSPMVASRRRKKAYNGKTETIYMGPLGILPESRRFSHVRSIMIRNMNLPHDDHFLFDCYLTVHAEETDDAVLYRSETIYHTRQPTWHFIDPPAHIVNRKEFYIRVWDALPQEDTCVYALRIKLRRFSYIGESVEAVQPHMKSLLLLEFQDGFYVKDKAAARSLATTNASASTFGYQKKPSYTRAQLHVMMKQSSKIAKAREQSTTLKKEIEVILPPYQKHLEKRRQRDLLRMRVEKLRKQVAEQKEELARNEKQIQENSEGMIQSLQVLSKAFTTVMVDQQILEADKETLDKELETTVELIDRCSLRRSFFARGLRTIYPITQGMRSADLPSTLFIERAPLPNNSDQFMYYNDEKISTALGFVAHCVQLLSCWLDVPLPYPIDLCGSHSSINDEISPTLTNSKFPLYMGRGIDRTRFEYGLYLLNLNLQQLMHHQGLEVPSLRQTLPNLQILLIALSEPLPSS